MIRPGPLRSDASPALSAVSTSAAAVARPLHVVEVLGAMPPGEDSAARLVARLVERLGAGDAFRFTVVCPADAAVEGDFVERLRALGAETVAVAMPDDPPWHAIQVLVGLIRNRQADVLHAHLPNAHRLAGLAGSITRTPVLATVQGLQLDMPDLEVHRLIASQLSVVSEASYFHALGLGIAAERISCEPFDAASSDEDAAASLDALGQRLRSMATASTASSASAASPASAAMAAPSVAPAMPAASGAPVAIVAVLDELKPDPGRPIVRKA